MALFLKRYRLQNSDPDAGGTGAAEDRGDNFTPTVDDPGAAADPVAEAAAAAALEAELAEKAKLAEGEKDDEKDDEKDEKDEKGDPKSKRARIPLERHEAILGKAREREQELQRELAEYKKGQATAAATADVSALDEQVTALETEYATLLTDGEIAKATAVMAKIRSTERQIGEIRNDQKLQAAMTHTVESTRFGDALKDVETRFPVLNPDHADHDAEIEATVIDLKTMYQGRGMTPAQALNKAVDLVLGTRPAGKAAEPPLRDATAAADAAAARTAAARAAAAKTVEATPPSTTKVGLDSDKAGGGLNAKGIMKMSQEEFAKLPEEVLARERGDIV